MARSGLGTAILLLVGGFALGACAQRAPSAPSSVSDPGASVATLALDLPVLPGDSAFAAYGLWPFGVHGGGHAADGHPGFDFEYRPGAPVVAAADGVVDAVLPDVTPGRSTVQVRHGTGLSPFLSSYANLIAVPASVVAGAPIARGQVVGTAGPLGVGSAATAMTHFQLADPAVLDASGTHIVSPERYFSAEARSRLDGIWRQAAYAGEWCEPFLSNPRAVSLPIERVWTRQSGEGPAAIRVRCTGDAVMDVTWLDGQGGTMGSGTARLGFDQRPVTTVDFTLAGETRPALYDIVSGRVSLAIAEPGQPRPVSLDQASIYGTQ